MRHETVIGDIQTRPVVLVTGGGSGIGLATAARFADAGYRVAVFDANPASETSVSELGALFACVDVRDEPQVSAAMNVVEAAYGRLDVLITAAGILQGAFQAVDDFPSEVFSRVMEVNVLGTFLACKHAVPLLVRSRGSDRQAARRVILCVASGAGIRGPSSSLAYGSSKSAVEGFCKTLERDLAPRGIRVNVVAPGSIDTPMKRQNLRDAAVHRGEPEARIVEEAHLGDPDGIARLLLLLASPDADYLTGTVHTR